MAEPTEKPESASCSVCRTQAAGLPTPGYIHDAGCPKAKPESAPLESARRFASWLEAALGEDMLTGRELQQLVERIEDRDAQVRADAIETVARFLEQPAMVFAFDDQRVRADVIARVRRLRENTQ